MLREIINEFWNEFWYELNAERHYARACIAIKSNTEEVDSSERDGRYVC